MSSLKVRHARTPATSGGPTLARLLQSIRRRNVGPAPRTASTTAPSALSLPVRGCLRLTMQDGVSRLYLLDARDFAATTSPDVAYDSRVHAAYLLALQGHRPQWLAQHLDLPPSAADSIVEYAERSGPDGPCTMPPRG